MDIRLTSIALAVSLLVSACGGGGGDGGGSSASSSSSVSSSSSSSSANGTPTAQAGPKQSVTTGTTVTLNGSASTDPDGDSLTYLWSIVSKPDGSVAALNSTSAVAPSVQVDIPGDYTFSLVVSDGKQSSSASLVTVTASASNAEPVANAGPGQNVATGTLVTLDGSTSSDANGDPLTYQWTLTSKPAGSAATLSSATSAKPTFTADVAGAYAASLVVNDGKLNSTAATVTITAAVANVAPVANAGVAQNVTTGTLVTLDGSSSSDANGDSLTYQWSLTSKPSGSAAALSSATSARPTFTADTAGTYVASLTVSDGKLSSTPVTTTITAAVANVAPVAKTGAAQNVTTGTLVTLDGSSSSDANGDSLTYLWALTSRPAGSTATLSSTTSARPTFTTDAAGTYVASLTVNDGKLSSTPATTTITAAVANVAPIANAGSTQTVAVGTQATLNGNASFDANGDSLTYLWTLMSKPTGSAAVLSSTTSASPNFTPDAAGTYVASLIVSDGKLSSTASTVSITAATPLAGMMATSRTLTKSGSPYMLTSTLSVPGGISLSVDSGATILGNGNSLVVEGTLNVNGTVTDRVVISNLNIQPAGKIDASRRHLIKIAGANMTGGSIYSPTGNAIYGSLQLTNSYFSSLNSYIYLWYPIGTNVIDKNRFVNCGGISYGIDFRDSLVQSLSITNNYFSGWTGSFAIENWAEYGSGTTLIQKNSFVNPSSIVITLPSGYSSAKISAANNYWGTTTDSVIQSMIYDRNDDLNSAGIVTYTPFLTAHDPGTPAP